jgi:long-chain fatty acid transport protein
MGQQLGLRWGSVAMLLICLATARSVRGDGVVRDGLGAISAGRGGVNLAFGDNGAVLMDNPAGMLQAECCGLADVGFDVLLTDLSYADPQNDVDATNDPFPMAQVGYWRKSADDRWALGVGMFAPAGFAAVYDMEGPPPALSGPRHYKSLGALARILPGVAYQVTDRLAVGGTLGVAVSHVELEGPYFLQSPGPFQGTPTMLDLQATGAALTWSLGAQYELTPATMLGVTYQSENRFRMNGNSRVEVPGLGATDFDTEVDLVWPRSLGLGVRQQLNCCRVVGVDVIWYDWSHAFDNVDLKFRDPSNPAFLALLGQQYDERFPLRWRDSVSVRVGMEQQLSNNRVIRTGYVYHRNPIPDSTLTPFIQATLEHAVSLGYGFQLQAAEVGLAYQYNFGRDRTVGASDLAGGDFSFSRVETDAHWLYLNFLRRF